MTLEPSNGDLVVRARRGDAPAMEALAHRYLRASHAVALSVLRHPADAEDASQEALLTALRSLDQCRDPARFAAWLFQSVRHRALKQVTHRRVRVRHADEVERGAVVEADAGRVVLRQRLLSALDRLTPTQREVVRLHDLEGWTHPEIAVALEISEAMSRQHPFLHEFMTWGRGAVAVGAILAVVTWLPVWSSARPSQATASRPVDPVLQVAAWAQAGAIPSHANLLAITGVPDAR